MLSKLHAAATHADAALNGKEPRPAARRRVRNALTIPAKRLRAKAKHDANNEHKKDLRRFARLCERNETFLERQDASR